MPTYAFQRARYFIEPGQTTVDAAPALERIDDISKWGTKIAWKPAYADCEIDVTTDLGTDPQTWLVFADEDGTATPVMDRLRKAGHKVVEVRAGDTYARKSDTSFTLAPEHGREAYARLLARSDRQRRARAGRASRICGW